MMKEKTSRSELKVLDCVALANSVDFSLIGYELGNDLKAALEYALAGEAVFHSGKDPLSIFRQTLSDSIRNIELHPRGKLFQDFLLKGPYENSGTIPKELTDLSLTDTESASAVSFIFSFMVNSFKGALAELLSTKPCTRLLDNLRREKAIPSDSRLFVGDAVLVHRSRGQGLSKGADLHILSGRHKAGCITVAGVGEVKSYSLSNTKLCRQLNQHIRRSRSGLNVSGFDYSGEKVFISDSNNCPAVRISVLPSCWKLARTFHFENTNSSRYLFVDRRDPNRDDEVKKIDNNNWRIALKWSQEALAEAAFEMTFWYMEKVGEILYANCVPKNWDDMTPAEAGQNAVKMMLYYAILRSRTKGQKQRAVALYNCYGFGYSLGMNFMNPEGRKEMLWTKDLEEIYMNGKTEKGCCIR
ncbi:MAG: hypothetical protein KAR40_15645 [Candidatus Sabulitectum sp.]|nr:hypothetical protein [Candidatus Sabulitectum sp.]